MANDKTKVSYNLDNLEKLMKCLKDDKFVRVGLIGAKGTGQHDSKSGLTNAELGSYHEFGGTSKNGKEQPPQRSFLWMPLKEHMKFDEADMKEMKKVMWKQMFVKNKPDTFWQTLMTKALDVIKDAFKTGGYGQWKPLSVTTEERIARKHKVMTKKQLKEYQVPKSGKLSKKFLQSDDFWFGALYEDEGSFKVTSGRTPLTDTGKLQNSITGKIMKRK